MIATARGYARFLQAVFFAEDNGLMREPNQRQRESNSHMRESNNIKRESSGLKPLLEAETIRDMTSSKAQHENDWGFMGYAIWVSSGKRGDGSYGRGGLWTGGGYEGTRYWIDPELGLAGIIMTQVYQMPEGGNTMEDSFRDELVRQVKKGKASAD